MDSIIVIKIGGNIIDDENALHQLLSDFSKINQPKILIHGGGKIATQLCEKLQIETQLIDGRRVTDEKTLDVVTMVYAGLINKKIVAKLQAFDVNAIGFTGADANSIQSHKRVHNEIDFGFVGDIDFVNADFFLDLIKNNFTPILAPITHDKKGNLLNTNADSMASQIAIALSKYKPIEFYYCFEKDGLLKDINDNSSIIHQVFLNEIETLKSTNIISDGMIPKINNVEQALKNGVHKVILCHAKDVLKNVNENAIFGTTFTIN